MPISLTSLEAVDYQHDSLFFDLLTKAIGAIRAEKTYSTTSDATKSLSRLIKNKTGIYVSVGYIPTKQLNAMVALPEVSKNNPILNDMMRNWHSDRTALRLINDQGGRISGTVDRRSGSVSGIFSEVPVDMFITEGLIDSKSVSDEEVAAVILHEIGHIFTYYESLVTTIRQNIYIAAVAKEAVEVKEQKLKLDLLDATCKNLKLNIGGEELVGYSSDKAIYAILLTKHIEQLRTELGTNYYDLRNFEAASDQYAARMGAARPLATALTKMGATSESRRSTAVYLLLEIGKVILFVAAMFVLNPLFIIISLAAYDPTSKIYDPPEARIKRIRHNLITASKNRSLSKQRKETLLKDIEIIDGLLSELNDRRSFYEILYTGILPNLNRQSKHLKYQQQLEEMLHNDLFKASMKFSI